MNKIPESQSTIGSALIVLSSLFYASYGIWTTLMGNFFSGYTASALRSVLVVVFLLPAAFLRHSFEPLNIKQNWKKLLGMIVASTTVWGLLYYSVLHAGVGVSSTVNYAAIVIGMMFFGWLLTGEKITSAKKWSLGFGMIGLSLIFVQTNSGSLEVLPLLAAIVSGLGVAANTVLAKQLPYKPTQTTLVVWSVSVVANVPMIFILGEPLPQWGLHIEWMYLVVFSLSSVLASWALITGLKHVEAGVAGILGLLEIVFGIAFGVILFGEKVEPLTILGVMVILLASAVPYLKRSSEA